MTPALDTSLRLATDADLAAVRSMVRSFCHEEMPALPVSDDRVHAAVSACHGQQGVMVTCAEDGTPVGTLGVVRTHPFWSETAWLVCLWSYVLMPHRRHAHLKRMLRAASSAAVANSMMLRIEVWNGPSSQGKIGLIRRGLACDAAGAILTTRG